MKKQSPQNFIVNNIRKAGKSLTKASKYIYTEADLGEGLLYMGLGSTTIPKRDGQMQASQLTGLSYSF